MVCFSTWCVNRVSGLSIVWGRGPILSHATPTSVTSPNLPGGHLESVRPLRSGVVALVGPGRRSARGVPSVVVRSAEGRLEQGRPECSGMREGGRERAGVGVPKCCLTPRSKVLIWPKPPD